MKCLCLCFFSIDHVCIRVIIWFFSRLITNQKAQGPRLHHFMSVSTPRLTSTELKRFTGSAHIWDKYVFYSGRGLIHRDQVDWHCVCDLSGASVDDRGQWHCLFLAGQELVGQTNRWNRGLWKRPAAFICLSWNPRTQNALTSMKQTEILELFICCVLWTD